MVWRAGVRVTFGGQVAEDLGVVVVEGSGLSLLDQDWLDRLRLDWREVYKLHTTHDTLDSQVCQSILSVQSGVLKLTSMLALL